MKTGVARVMISVNSVNGAKGGSGSQYLTTIVRDYAQDLLTESGMIAGKATVMQANIVQYNRFNPHLDYKVFIVPALMVMLLTMLCGFLPACRACLWTYAGGSLLTIYLYAISYVFIVSGLGLVISNYSNTMQQAQFVIAFFIVILILMSGLFFPVNSMPHGAQVATLFNPLRHFMEVMRAVYLKGSSMSELMPQFFALCGFAAVFDGWAVISYKKSN